MQKIPRSMSTQHPDNASMPFFAQNSLLEGEDEIQEAFYAFSHLGCTEQMWDCEGKEVDGFVVKKLLTKYENFFREKKLGQDLRLTMRVPNPSIEKTEAKILLETLEGIPRSFDTAKIFYGEEIPPIFEVILPMTSSAREVNQVYHYYKEFVAGKQSKHFFDKSQKISDWIGHFSPQEINVIPLIETKENLVACDKIVGEYLEGKNLESQRVFLARSDPALNYGNLAAVLLGKIALYRLNGLEEKTSVDIYPIIGVGSAPFRGNLKPSNMKNCILGYPSVQTFTLQSAFKYDYSQAMVSGAITELNGSKRKKPLLIDEKKALEIITNTSSEYVKAVREIAPLVNKIASFVPKRRKRKLHIGLFGYSRQMQGTVLPRAITFCAALYSIGLPPEILGLSGLKEKEKDFVLSAYKNFENDLSDAMQFFNKNSLSLLPKTVAKKIRVFSVDTKTNEEHKKITDEIIMSLKKDRTENLSENISRAAFARKFLG